MSQPKFFAKIVLSYALSTAAQAAVEVKPDTAPPQRTLPYQPYPMQDPRTGKNLNPDDMVTLSDGRKVKARDYFKNLNDHEKYLTGRGYTLRNGNNPNLGTVAPVKSTEPLKAEQLQKMQEQIASQTAPRPAALSSLSPTPGGLSPSPRVCNTTKTVSGSKPFFTSLGNRNSSQMDITANAFYFVNCEKVMGIVRGRADSVVLGSNMPIFEVGMRAEATSSATALIDGDVFLAGKKVFDLDQTQASIQLTKSFTNDYDRSFQARGTVGPIPISFTVGAKGGTSITFALQASGVNATGKVHPAMRVSTYAEGAVDIFVARAGVGASLLLLDINLPSSFTSTLTTSPGRFLATGVAEGTGSFRTLDGRLFLFGELNLILFRPRFEVDLIKFSGFGHSGAVLLDRQDIDLAVTPISGTRPGGAVPPVFH